MILVDSIIFRAYFILSLDVDPRLHASTTDVVLLDKGAGWRFTRQLRPAAVPGTLHGSERSSKHKAPCSLNPNLPLLTHRFYERAFVCCNKAAKSIASFYCPSVQCDRLILRRTSFGRFLYFHGSPTALCWKVRGGRLASFQPSSPEGPAPEVPG